MAGDADDRAALRWDSAASPGAPSLERLAPLGIARVSFGPQVLGLTLAHLGAAAAQLTARGEYPAGPAAR